MFHLKKCTGLSIKAFHRRIIALLSFRVSLIVVYIVLFRLPVSWMVVTHFQFSLQMSRVELSFDLYTNCHCKQILFTHIFDGIKVKNGKKKYKYGSLLSALQTFSKKF